METRSEQRRRELSERRQRATKLINRKWEEGKTSPRGDKEQDQGPGTSPPSPPSSGGEVDEAERQREERLARREERRRQREEEEREHLERLEERRKRREELKAQIGSSPSTPRRASALISVSEPAPASPASAVPSPISAPLSFSSPPAPVSSPSQLLSASPGTSGATTSPRRASSERETKPPSPRALGGSMIAIGTNGAGEANANGHGERSNGDGETKHKRETLRGALFELEELGKNNEKDLMKRESFLDLQSLVSTMSVSPASALISNAAASATPIAGSLATFQVSVSVSTTITTNGHQTKENKPTSPRRAAQPKKDSSSSSNANSSRSPNSKELEPLPATGSENGGKGKKKGSILQLGKLKLPSPTLGRSKKHVPDPLPSFTPPAPPKSKEDKKKAQLRNYTIAGGRGIQHELPLGVSWKDLKAILASSNAPTTERIVKSLPMPRDTRLTREELFGSRSIPNLQVLRKHLFEEGRLELDLAKELLAKGKALFAACPNVLELASPLAICGDVHGQYYDVLTLMDTAGHPRDTPYLFLGDYVDRGCFSTEVCFYLVACKMNYPHTFHMLRGNHECRQLAEFFNFKAECKSKYEESIYMEFMEMFDALPLAALIDTKQGQYLAVHGGLSPFIKNVDEIRKLNRFSEPPDQGAFCDLLWSDPLVDQYDLNAREHQTVTYLSNRNRGCGYLYGWKAVTEFLEANKLVSVIRAHEVQQYGYAEHWFKQDSLRSADDRTEEPRIPPVITVFSAPNYCDLYQNKGAFMWLQPDGKYEFKQISWSTHPAYLPQFMNGITFSFPYIAEQLSKFCFTVLQSVEDDEQQMAADFATEDAHAERIRQKVETVRKLMIIMKKLREENVRQLPEEAVDSAKQRKMDRNLSVFERALRIDKKNEARPKVDRLYRTL